MQINCKLYLDKRSVKSDGTSPIKIVISYHGTTALISTDVSVERERWDVKSQKIKSGSDKSWKNQELNNQLQTTLQKCYKVLSERTPSTATEVKNLINKISSLSGVSTYLIPYAEEISNSKTGRTREIYLATVSKLKKLTNYESITIQDVNIQWLEQFDNHLRATGSISSDSRSIHHRNLRHILNRAIDDEIISKSPYRKYKIKAEPIKHTDLPVEDIRQLAQWEVEQNQQEARDFYMLSFYLRGINPGDLLLAKWSDITGNYLEYRRSKTGQHFRVRLEPEALSIINKYKGKKNLLSRIDGMSITNEEKNNKRVRDTIHNAIQTYNKHLKRIGVYRSNGKLRILVKSLYPKITLYTARHSWATIAYDICDDYKAVQDGLGHSSNAITDRYVRRSQSKVDAVNRQVIDYVLYNNECNTI